MYVIKTIKNKITFCIAWLVFLYICNVRYWFKNNDHACLWS